MDKLSKKGVVWFLMLIALIWPLFVRDVALSAEFPTKAIEIVLPWPAGGKVRCWSADDSPISGEILRRPSGGCQ